MTPHARRSLPPAHVYRRARLAPHGGAAGLGQPVPVPAL